MNKKVYTTPKEQAIYGSIIEREVISSDEIGEIFPDEKPHALNKVASSLMKKGYLFPLKRGMYLVQKEPTEKPVIQNPFHVAVALYPGYIGFSSALRLYDLLDYEPFTIFVVSTNRSSKIRIGEYEFRSVAMGKRAVGFGHHKGVYVSSVAKTFFDCFFRPQHAGGYQTITKALYEKGEMDWKEFLYYLGKFASSSLCQRTGYVLGLMGALDFKVPCYVIEQLRKRRSTNAKLLPSMPSKGTYNKEWRLLDNLGPESILGWFHG